MVRTGTDFIKKFGTDIGTVYFGSDYSINRSVLVPVSVRVNREPENRLAPLIPIVGHKW